MSYSNNFDVIIIGGGHAGTEAAMASTRLGALTLLVTHSLDTIGAMSCNPAIGGIGKGHLVKEIDALGGLMARAIDHAGIQFRMLNLSKGPAVRATRAQADRVLYQKMISNTIKNQPNLVVLQQIVEDLIIKDNRVIGIITKKGLKFYTPSVVLTVGTFLNGKIHIGLEHRSGGRVGDPASIRLAYRLRELPFRVKRFKTGTPPRIDGRSVDFSFLTRQDSDHPLPVFSFMGYVSDHPRQVACYITSTNNKTHEIIRENLNKSPLYTGVIEGVGPRSCPSIEDKVVKFSDRNSHQIFLEPEGLTSFSLYPNGISTSMPFDVQTKIVHSIKGLENAKIIKPGYAIEYDFFDPRDLHLTLESKLIAGLFFAGQINGTTGYEEAAAQGMLAGLNAVRSTREEEGWAPRRDQAYIGVLVDDLCTLDINEPYRMFTSRAEYRLMLREDNADIRLTEIGRKLGLVDDARWVNFCTKLESIELERQRLRDIWVHPATKGIEELNLLLKTQLVSKVTGEELLRRPEINYTLLTSLTLFAPALANSQAASEVEIEIKYEGYILRQKKKIFDQISKEELIFPVNMDFNVVSGLSDEFIFKLNHYKPTSIGQASRISGVTSPVVSILWIWLKKQELLYSGGMIDSVRYN